MTRLIGTVAGLIAIAVLLPMIAQVAAAAVPFLLSLLLLLVGFRLLLPPARRK